MTDAVEALVLMGSALSLAVYFNYPASEPLARGLVLAFRRILQPRRTSLPPLALLAGGAATAVLQLGLSTLGLAGPSVVSFVILGFAASFLLKRDPSGYLYASIPAAGVCYATGTSAILGWSLGILVDLIVRQEFSADAEPAPAPAHEA